jgi:hypothetical protein
VSKAVAPAYPPLTRRHKVTFGAAALIALALVAGIATARMALINWWLVNCTSTTAHTSCTVAKAGFTWWWIIVLAGVLLIAFVAHRLTLDRLTVAPSPPAPEPTPPAG